MPQGPAGLGYDLEPLGEAFEGGDCLGGLGGFVGRPSLLPPRCRRLGERLHILAA
jgi:hypothetical protein